MKLVYAANAIDDLIRLREFIAEHDPASAARIGEQLVERIENLLVFPEMGRPAAAAPNPEIIRDMVFGDYTVRYALHQNIIAVLRIWHHFENRK